MKNSMTLSTCPNNYCENKVTSPFSCSICDLFKCIECMTESSMSICFDCDGRANLSNRPSFWDWEEGSLKDWFYHGFISKFYERCERGDVFKFYYPFVNNNDGFTIKLLRHRSWDELEESIQRAKSSPNFAKWLSGYAFRDYHFSSVDGIAEAFEKLKKRIQEEDPWWVQLDFEILSFENNLGPLPWDDHGRLIITLDMGKK